MRNGLSPEDIYALKDCYFGRGNEITAQRAIEAILQKVCRIGDENHHSDPLAMAKQEGGRAIGLQILAIINEPYEGEK